MIDIDNGTGYGYNGFCGDGDGTGNGYGDGYGGGDGYGDGDGGGSCGGYVSRYGYGEGRNCCYLVRLTAGDTTINMLAWRWM